MKDTILNMIKKAPLIIDGAMGTELQKIDIPQDSLIYDDIEAEGCNELLNITNPNILHKIHRAYLSAGANLIKTNTFGSIPWVLDEYDLAEITYESAKAGANIVRKLCDEYNKTTNISRFVLGSLGPGTKLPSLGHITYDEMYDGYKIAVRGLIDGGVDIILLETCQDPLQIKSAINAIRDINKDMPIMVSVTIELTGTMLIGTDAKTIATILEPFDIISLGFNCGSGPEQVKKHIQTLSEVWHKPISVHANAGLPQNRGGYTFYPMGPDEFAKNQKEFLEFDGVSFLGGCCGTTPQHIAKLSQSVKGIIPKVATGSHPKSLASLFQTIPLKQNPPPLLVGERSNATGSKAFRELLKAEKFDETLSVANEQVNSGAHVIDVSVGFAGRDETKDMIEVVSRYASKLSLPLMPDSTQISALEVALKLIGGKAIINSVNFEDGVEKFDKICQLAKRYGASLVCLVIDEKGMAKTKQRKLEIARRIYDRAVNIHKIDPRDLVYDMLTFTIGSGDEEYFDAGIQTLDAIREFSQEFSECGTILGLSNISFGLDKNSRMFLNSVFLHHAIKAGLTSVIINVKHIIALNKMDEKDIKICEDLIFNRRENGYDPLIAFIEHFSDKSVEQSSDEDFEKLSDEEKIKKLLMDGDKEKLIDVALSMVERVGAQIIVNEWLIDGMKVIGELFGNGQMQLPFVLQSAEAMKACVDRLNVYLPKVEKKSKTTLVLGTVKGDVHDVGKNLVDIILSNNGFDVINLGIKVEINQFLEAFEKYNADAIGMSGLLVKSTNEMKNNLIYLKEKGVNIPILLGGAALNKAFVDEYCRVNYDGAIFYCKDAFDGVVAIQRIEKANGDYSKLDTKLNSSDDVIVEKKEKKLFDSKKHKPILLENKHQFNPPFCGKKVYNIPNLKELTFKWINKRILFKQRWGYSKKKSKDYEKLLKTEIEPLFNEYKELLLNSDIFTPIAIYGYFYCKSDDNILNVYDCDKKNIIASFDFPRSANKPHRSIADYFKNDDFDIVAFTFASSGLNLTPYEQELYKKGEFFRYYTLHGLGVELAEAIAEILHKQIRLDLNITDNEGSTLNDVKMGNYQGCRYSPGYAACPDLELSKYIFDLLKPQEFGVKLSETFQIDPEQSTVAIVAPNEKAKYFNP